MKNLVLPIFAFFLVAFASCNEQSTKKNSGEIVETTDTTDFSTHKDEHNNLCETVDSSALSNNGNGNTDGDKRKPSALEVLDNIQQQILQNPEYYEPQNNNSIVGYVESASKVLGNRINNNKVK